MFISSLSSRGCSNCSKLCNENRNLGYISQPYPKVSLSVSQMTPAICDIWEKSFEQVPVQKSLSFEQFRQKGQKFCTITKNVTKF